MWTESCYWHVYITQGYMSGLRVCVTSCSVSLVQCPNQKTAIKCWGVTAAIYWPVGGKQTAPVLAAVLPLEEEKWDHSPCFSLHTIWYRNLVPSIDLERYPQPFSMFRIGYAILLFLECDIIILFSWCVASTKHTETTHWAIYVWSFR